MGAVMSWLNGLPTVVLFVGLVVVGLLVAAGLTWFATRPMEDQVRTRTSLSVVAVVGVVAALYSVLVAFVIVNEWQAFNDAQSQVSSESGSLTAAYFDAGVLAEPARTEIQQALLRYDRSVICVEIPYLADHQGPALPTRRALQQVYADDGARFSERAGVPVLWQRGGRGRGRSRLLVVLGSTPRPHRCPACSWS